MQKKINVLLIGQNAFVQSVFRRHKEYVIVSQDIIKNHTREQEQNLQLIVFACDDLRLCYQICQKFPSLPLIVVSANKNQADVCRALDLGADDYVILPFSENEFLARLRVLVRRSNAPMQKLSDLATLASQDQHIILHVTEQQCFIRQQKIHLTTIEFELLRILLQNSGKVLTHQFLLQQIWGPIYKEEHGYLRVYIRHLRRKIEDDPAHPFYITTQTRIGYVFRNTSPSSVLI